MSDPPSPEVEKNQFGPALTEKITTLMRHPKSDVDSDMLAETRRTDGDAAADVDMVYGRSWLTAYYKPTTRLAAFFRMPTPGSPQPSDAESRWEMVIHAAVGISEDAELVRTFQLRIDEENMEITYTRDILIYVDGILQKRLFEGTGQDLEEQEEELSKWLVATQRESEFAQLFGDKPYKKEDHVLIVAMLDTFTPEDEVVEYDPANGGGIL